MPHPDAARLSDAEAADWQEFAHRRHYAPGDILIHEGRTSRSALLLTRGRVKVTARSAEGPVVVLGYRAPGEVFGEMAALDGGPHSATVTALDPAEAWALTADHFAAFLTRQPRVSTALLLVMIRRLREADGQRLNYLALTVVERIAERLTHLAEQYGEPATDGIRLPIRLTYVELAATAVASRESAQKAVRRLRETGAIAIEPGRRFLIRDAQLLRDIALGHLRGT